MKAKTAATVILVYSVLLFAGSVWGALLANKFSLYTVPVSALLFVGPAIGIYRRVNWCRIFLGVWFVLILVFFVSMPFQTDFNFRPVYLAYLLGSAAPVYLLFMHSPLKDYTRPPDQATSRP